MTRPAGDATDPPICHQRPETSGNAGAATHRAGRDPPLPRHATTRETMLGGRVIPAGSFVRAWLALANRDEAVFPDAATYDPRRTPNRHIAFGLGLHFCLGAPLARLEAQVGLTALYRRYPELRVVVGAPIPYLASDIVHGPSALPVRL